MQITTFNGLLICAAVLEWLAGVTLMLAPGFAVALLFGVDPGVTARTVARLAGVALLSLGTACWGASEDAGGIARTSTMRGITLYNAGAGLIFMAVATSGSATGVVIWIAGILHLSLAAAFAQRWLHPGSVA